jgi:hypothetical protein
VGACCEAIWVIVLYRAGCTNCGAGKTTTPGGNLLVEHRAFEFFAKWQRWGKRPCRRQKRYISRSLKETSVSAKPVSRTRLQSFPAPPEPLPFSAARWHSMQLVA